VGKYYLFKINISGDITTKNYEQIKQENVEYINYNKFLIQYYGTNIKENEDYIAFVNSQTAIIVLNEDCFNKNELEDVFEILYDSIYMKRGEGFEENSNTEWASKIG